MGSHIVTCHTTQLNSEHPPQPQPDRPVVNRVPELPMFKYCQDRSRELLPLYFMYNEPYNPQPATCCSTFLVIHKCQNMSIQTAEFA